jgi:argininosuccinate lyase
VSLIRGRFQKETEEAVNQYSASLPFDRRLYRYDIAGSIAHARMLARQGIITDTDARAIIRGLKVIEKEIEKGEFQFRMELDDIHMNIEARLTEMIGPSGARLHTARSRNDQVALDTRLFTKDCIKDTVKGLKALQKTLIDTAEVNSSVVLPGYTHLQRAQPVLLAHHLLAYFEMFQRDIERFTDCMVRTDVMPLGSGALAGVAYNIDREFVARQLGFSRISRNSMDTVSDRDFIIEFEACASLCMMHLSRLAEEMILWSTAEFGFIELDDAYTHGSSIMPQKKNPDVAELARGKVGRIYGRLIAILTTMKGLPLTYNSDLQEDKEGLFEVADTLLSTLEIFDGMLKTMKIKPLKMAEALDKGYLLATDIADYLVSKGETFRNAHEAVGKLVTWAIEKGLSFNEISLSDYQRFSNHFEDDIYTVTIEKSLAARDNPGGTAPEQVKVALEVARKTIQGDPKKNKKSKISG